jgi:stage V sporulation protein D (sporulation-specific penicillin-binding protein)
VSTASRRNEQALIKKRLEVVFLLFLTAVVVLGVRLTCLQLFQARGFVELAQRMQGRTLEVAADRGKITDRNGAELATDVLRKAIAINPRVVADPEATVARLAALLKLDEKERELVQQKLERARQKRKTFYCQLWRPVDRKLALHLLGLSKTDPALKGLWLEDWPVRVNPSGRDGMQLLGTVSTDGRGLEGLELMFDPLLRGKNGERQVRVNGLGQPITASETRVVEPMNGQQIRLTLDRDVQHFVEAELDKVAAEQQPDAATAVVLDVRSGDILAMANWPSFDPKAKEITPAQRRNRAITDLFEPGSIFKVLTGAAALECGINTSVYCSGTRAIGNRSVHCAHGAHHGAVNLQKMIEQSCNLAAGTYAERIGAERLYRFLDSMGIQQKTGVEYPGEEYGRMLRPDKWKTMRTVNIGFGQGIVVTPIQLLAAYAAIANDGIYIPPRLVAEAPGSTLPERKPRRVMSPENALTLRRDMETVVTQGTGKSAKIAGYSVAGKTGTAQIAKNGRYGHGYVASFAGFLPVEKPRLAILVSVWHPRRGQYGGVVSAPVFREIARQSVAYLKIPPDAPFDLRDGSDRATFTRHARVTGGGAGAGARAND